MSVDRLNVHVDALALAEEKAGVRMFLGRPDHWYENPRWLCASGHIGSSYLKSEMGGDLWDVLARYPEPKKEDRTLTCRDCGSTPHRWRPSPEAAGYRCPECGGETLG